MSIRNIFATTPITKTVVKAQIPRLVNTCTVNPDSSGEEPGGSLGLRTSNKVTQR